MNKRLADIAAFVGGAVEGDGDRQISGAAPFDLAGKGDISFADGPKFIRRLEDAPAGAVIVPMDCPSSGKNLIRVKNPKAAFARAVSLFHPPREPKMSVSDRAHLGDGFAHGEHVSVAPFVSIGDHVTLGDRVWIHPNVTIGDGVVIGSDVVIESNVSILKGCMIGSRVIIHAGTVIGSDGFGFAADGDQYVKIPQTGHVVIEDDVEIGACNTIDRATFGATRIKRGVKTDNLVHVAHNVTVGENTVLVAQVGIAGSVTIGRNVILAGQVGISQHLSIGDHVIVGPQSGIAKSIPDKEIFTGSPGMPHRQWLKVQTIIQKLPELKKAVASLERRLRKLEESLS